MREDFGMMGGFGFGGFFMILWWVLVLVGIFVLVKWIVTPSGAGDRNEAARPSAASRSVGGSRALDILNERYARGQIDEQDYKIRKRDLSQ